MEDVAAPASAADQMFDMAENVATQCRKMLSSAEDYLQPREKWEAGKQFSRTHPVAAFFVILLVVMSIIPVFCFCAFAVCTTLAILASFLFFEAFTLTVGGIVLLGVLSFAAFLALGSSLVFAAGLCVVTMSRSTIQRLRYAAKHSD